MESALAELAPADDVAIADWLHARSASCITGLELFTFLRGAQAAALHRGFLLQFNARRVANRATASTTLASIAPNQWEMIVATQRPDQAAAAVLALAGMPLDRICNCPTTAVAEDGTWIQLGDRVVEVPPPARSIMIAQRIYRLTFPHAMPHLFLVHSRHPLDTEHTPRRVARMVDAVAKQTGIAIRLVRSDPLTAGWRWRFGFNVVSLQDGHRANPR
jgi:hypothetical protein